MGFHNGFSMNFAKEKQKKNPEMDCPELFVAMSPKT